MGARSARPLSHDGTRQPDALWACLSTIDDAPDNLHVDQTPSMQALAAMDRPALPAIIDLLLSEDRMTRLHAERALERSRLMHHGFVFGIESKSTPGAEEKTRAEWQANGAYDFEAPLPRRIESVRRWRSWLERN